MKKVEYWRWRYRDKDTGRICRTMFQLTVEEAADYPEAQRIEGSMVLRVVDDQNMEEQSSFTLKPSATSPSFSHFRG